MADMFGETINEFILGGIQTEIEEHLFDQWTDSNLDEGPEYAEYKFFSFASDEIKKQYNEFYNYTEKDEYYLC